MKDSRAMLDNVRAKVRGVEKMLVVYIGPQGELRCSQTNCSQKDIEQIITSLQANLMSERIGLHG